MSEGSSPEVPQSKKRRVSSDVQQTPPPEETLYMASVSKTPLFNDNPRELLRRSVAAILLHVGFSGAKEDALEALCSQVETCQYLDLW